MAAGPAHHGRAVRPHPPGAPRPSSAAEPFDNTDAALAQLLAEDGRTTAAAAAARTGHPESTVRRRITRLLGRAGCAWRWSPIPGGSGSAWTRTCHCSSRRTAWTPPAGRSRRIRRCTG
ncbi:AsnC family transcriptional regulator [Streptacidiphilus monticola]